MDINVKNRFIELWKKYFGNSELPIIMYYDEETRDVLVKALQIMTITRQRRRVTLNLGESYKAPDEGWLEEDFGGDEGILETVKAVEDPRWNQQED